MMIALLRNIGASTTGKAQCHAEHRRQAIGDRHRRHANGAPVRLVGRVEARGTRFYQIIVLGPSERHAARTGRAIPHILHSAHDDYRSSPALQLRALRKAFGRPAVDGLDLTSARGELYALLGPNGAGKTTTLRMVTGLLAPDSGSVEVLGVDLATRPRCQAQDGVPAGRPDVVREAQADRVPGIRRRLVGHRGKDAEPRARRCSTGSTWTSTRTSSPKVFRAG
jgi:hypothetical protein